MATKSKKKRSKVSSLKARQARQARLQMHGLCWSFVKRDLWGGADENITDVRRWHKNPVNTFRAKEICNRNMEHILEEDARPFLWRITAHAVKEGEYTDDFRFVARCALNDALKPLQDEMESLEHGAWCDLETKKQHSQYDYFKVVMECLGDREPVPEDYERFSVA
jgi:hypothetical protein